MIDIFFIYINDAKIHIQLNIQMMKDNLQNDKFNLKKKNTARFLVALTKKQNVSQIINKY